MIFIGTDIVEVARIERVIYLYRNRFLKYIFTDLEIEFCINKRFPSIHFSGKFAAKEAIKKAILSSNIINKISLHDIEINNKSDGSPNISFLVDNFMIKQLSISISHTENYATATAIAML